MKLNVIGRQMNVFEETKQQIAKKLAKLDKFFPVEGEATVTLSRKHGASRVEITINADGTLYRSEQDAGDFREAIDRCHRGAAQHVSNGLMSVESLYRIFTPHLKVDTVISDDTMYQVCGVKR